VAAPRKYSAPAMHSSSAPACVSTAALDTLIGSRGASLDARSSPWLQLWLQLASSAPVRRSPPTFKRPGQSAYGTTANRSERDHDGLAVWEHRRCTSLLDGSLCRLTTCRSEPHAVCDVAVPQACLKQRPKADVSGQQRSESLRQEGGADAELSWPNRHGSWPLRGAGDRDRTGMASLEGWGSTIELHPRGAPSA
jgi:hypothetical protein